MTVGYVWCLSFSFFSKAILEPIVDGGVFHSGSGDRSHAKHR